MRLWDWRRVEEPEVPKLHCVTQRPEVYPRPHITRTWDEYADRFVWIVMITSQGCHRGTLHADAFEKARKFVAKQNLYGR